MSERIKRLYGHDRKDMTQDEREASVLEELRKHREEATKEEGEAPTLCISAGIAPVVCRCCNKIPGPEENIPHVMVPFDGDTRVLTLCGWCVDRLGKAIKDTMAEAMSAQLVGLLDALRGLAPKKDSPMAKFEREIQPDNVKPFPGKAPKWEM